MRNFITQSDFVRIKRIAGHLRTIIKRDLGEAEFDKRFAGNEEYLVRVAIEAMGLSGMFYDVTDETKS